MEHDLALLFIVQPNVMAFRMIFCQRHLLIFQKDASVFRCGGAKLFGQIFFGLPPAKLFGHATLQGTGKLFGA